MGGSRQSLTNSLHGDGDFPDVYAMVASGDCMEPTIRNADPLIVSSIWTPEAGDTVVVHLLPEFVRPGEGQVIVKRLKAGLHGARFPADQTESDCPSPVVLEQTNPTRTLHIAHDRIAAIHKVLGLGVLMRNGEVRAPRIMLVTPSHGSRPVASF